MGKNTLIISSSQRKGGIFFGFDFFSCVSEDSISRVE